MSYLKKHKTAYLSLFLICNFFFCELSKDPFMPELKPSEADPEPYFHINYTRWEFGNVMGFSEGVRFYLYHIIEGKILDYGDVSFGDVPLYYQPQIHGNYYFNYLHRGYPGREFRPEFRFDRGNLIFKAKNSTRIEDVSIELKLPEVTYIESENHGLVVPATEDWELQLNKRIDMVYIDMMPLEPLNTYRVGYFLYVDGQSITISDSLLQELKNHSDSDKYFFTLHCLEYGLNAIMVKGKGSAGPLYVPVSLESNHYFHFTIPMN